MFVAAARSWWLLVHGGCSFMAAARSWRPLVHEGRSFMVAACLLWLPVHLSGLLISAVIELELRYNCLSRLVTVGLVRH